MASDASFRHRASSFKWAFVVLLFITLIISHHLHAQTEPNVLIKSETDLPFTYKFDDSDIQEGNELRIKGQNNSDEALLLVIRIDNDQSRNYHSRFNREFSLQPGDFSLTIPLTGLKAPNRQPLPPPYKEIVIFNSGNNNDIVLSNAAITSPPPRTKEVLALDFGKKGGSVFPGFEQVTPEDKRLTGSFFPRSRPFGDPLIQDGLEGFETFSMPWENGQWKLTLWLQEQGEWEYLPHYLQRKVIAEGETILNETLSEAEWVNNVYLAGTRLEAVIDGDLWKVVGQRRTAPISTLVNITDNKLDIQWVGNRSARYAAALTLEPVDGHFTAEVEKQRQTRFKEKWSVKNKTFSPQPALLFSDDSRQPSVQIEQQKIYPAARNSLLNLTFRINSPETDSNPVVVAANPRNGSDQKLATYTRYGHWRYERPEANATSLIIDDSYLRSDIYGMSLSPQLPRHIYLQVEIPKDAKPGIYKGNMQLLSHGALKVVDYAVEVLPILLPDMKASVGLYLEPAPYYEWFDGLRKHKPFATACDLSLLALMGFSTVAPALETPVNEEHRKKLAYQLKQLLMFGFNGPTLAYAPLKRLLVAQPMEEALKSMTQLKAELMSSMLQVPYWSIYDEPNPDKFSAIRDTANKLHSQSLDMKTGGHLNNPKQLHLLDVTDLAVMNHGYGVSANTIKKMQKNRMVWLYNMPSPRLAAGFYLWKTKAEGYLQWHARMPTADPFDPTDGREGDAVYLYPWSSGCPKVMNIHKRLLALHEATLDLRWLQWLDEEAEDNDAAKKLAEKLQKAIPDDWQDADNSLSDKQLMLMRQTIIEFAWKRPSKK